MINFGYNQVCPGSNIIFLVLSHWGCYITSCIIVVLQVQTRARKSKPQTPPKKKVTEFVCFQQFRLPSTKASSKRIHWQCNFLNCFTCCTCFFPMKKGTLCPKLVEHVFQIYGWSNQRYHPQNPWFSCSWLIISITLQPYQGDLKICNFLLPVFNSLIHMFSAVFSYPILLLFFYLTVWTVSPFVSCILGISPLLSAHMRSAAWDAATSSGSLINTS